MCKEGVQEATSLHTLTLSWQYYFHLTWVPLLSRKCGPI